MPSIRRRAPLPCRRGTPAPLSLPATAIRPTPPSLNGRENILTLPAPPRPQGTPSPILPFAPPTAPKAGQSGWTTSDTIPITLLLPPLPPLPRATTDTFNTEPSSRVPTPSFRRLSRLFPRSTTRSPRCSRRLLERAEEGSCHSKIKF